MLKPDLYIDIDGVLIASDDGYLQMRPGAISFLARCLTHFNCFWLTAWGESEVRQLFSLLYAGALTSRIAYRSWRDASDNKTVGIDFSRPFFWIDDNLYAQEHAILDARGALDSYIKVNPQGRDELDRVWRELASRIGLAIPA